MVNPKFSLREPPMNRFYYPILCRTPLGRHFLTVSAPEDTTMKSIAVLFLLVCTVRSATENPSTDPPVSSTSTRSSPTPKRLEPKPGEGRGIAKMEVTDAQLEMALKDKRYLQRQLKCTLGEAPCDPVGRRLRTLAPLVVRGSCPQCTPTEMRQIQKVLLHMQRNFPKEWARIVRTYQ